MRAGRDVTLRATRTGLLQRRSCAPAGRNGRHSTMLAQPATCTMAAAATLHHCHSAQHPACLCQVATDALVAMEKAMARDGIVTNDRQLACARINSQVCPPRRAGRSPSRCARICAAPTPAKRSSAPPRPGIGGPGPPCMAPPIQPHPPPAHAPPAPRRRARTT